MRILVDTSQYNLRNLGDQAMLGVALDRLHEQWPAAELLVFTQAPERLRAMSPAATPNPLGDRECWLRRGLTPRFLRRWDWLALPVDLQRLRRPTSPCFWNVALPMLARERRRRADRFLALVDSCDLVVGTGGGYVNDVFRHQALRVLATLSLAQYLGKPTALLGQGLGPIHTRRLKRYLHAVFPELGLLTLREGKQGVSLARSHGARPEHLCVTGDDALHWLAARRPMELGGGLGINLRLAEYAEVTESQRAALTETLRAAAARLNAPLIPLPIEYGGKRPDTAPLATLLGKPQEDSEPPAPEQLFEQVARCRLVVTGSYHAATFALGMGVSAIGLAGSRYYLEKFEGLAGQFGRGVQAFHLNAPHAAERLAAAIEEEWQRAEVVRAALVERCDQQIAAGRRAYARLAKLLPRQRRAAA